MQVQWKTDIPTIRLFFGRLNRASLAILRRGSVKRVLDLGGGNGWFANLVRTKKGDVEVHNVDIEPNDLGNGVIHHRASILDLPFPNGHFQGVTAHAVLHHVPDDLDRAVDEAWRVMEPGSYFVIEEPAGENPLADFARKHFRTEKHDPGERPLPVQTMLRAVGRRFRILRVEHHFLFSYLAPHAIARLPRWLIPLARIDARILLGIDRMLLRAFPFLRRYCAYVIIIAKKK